MPTASVGRTTAYYRGSDLAYRDIGQSFTVSGSSFSMQAVTWRLYGFHANVPGQNFLIKIYELASPTAAPNPATDLISTQTGTLPAMLVDDDYITFILDTPVPLETGHHYLVMFGFAGPTSADGGSETFGLERTNAASGLSGRMWLCANGSFASDNKGLTFVIHDSLPSTEFSFGAASSLYGVALSSSLTGDPDAQASADRLVDLLGQITGHSVVQDNGSSTGIMLGVADDYPVLAETYGLGGASLTSREDYLIYSESDKLYVVGASTLALRHAVSDLLHRWGFRQYFPSARWRIVPSAATLELSATCVEKPDFFVRDLFITTYYNAAQSDAYEEWRIFNRMGSGFSLNTNHAYNEIYGRNQTEFDANPDYFAMVDGMRQTTAANKKFNAASSELLALIEVDAANWFSVNPDQDSISMEPSDGSGWDNSGDAYTDIGSPSNQAVTMSNRVAFSVGASLGKYVGMYAYGQHQYVPTIAVEPNVIVSFATHLAKVNLATLIDGWIDQGVELIGIRDYGSVFSWNRDIPAGSEGVGLDYAEHYLPLYHDEWGARFYTSEFENAWAAYGLGAYYLSWALWDIDASQDAVMNDFVERAFGDAAPQMLEFYELIAGQGATYVRWLPSSELYGLLDNGLAAVPSDSAIRERIAGLVGYVRYLELYYATQTALTTDREDAIEELYDWVLRMAPWDLLPTNRMVRHNLGFKAIFAPGEIPTTTEIDTIEVSAQLNPVTLSELITLASLGALEGPATSTYSVLTSQTQSTTSPWVRQGAAFVFPLDASESVSLTLVHRRLNVSPSAPRYVLLDPSGVVLQQGRLTAEDSTAISFTSTNAGNYVIMTDPSLGGVRCVSDSAFVMQPLGGRLNLFKYAGILHIMVPAGESMQVVVGGYGSAEYVDTEILDSASAVIASASDVDDDSNRLVVDLPVETSNETYQIKLSSPASGNYFEDAYIEFKGGYVSPVALNPNLF